MLIRRFGSYVRTPELQSMSERLPVIRIPVKFNEKYVRGMEKRRRAAIIGGYNEGDKKRPIIVCRRSEFNHYVGKTYKSWKKLPLVSESWRSRRSVGDYFSFTNFGKSGSDSASSKKSFSELGFDANVVEELKKAGFKRPTLIQGLSAGPLLNGDDTLVASETGNGKTIAFLAPLLHKVLLEKSKERPLNSPLAAVVAPSRELAAQIYAVTQTMAQALNINVHYVCGSDMKRKMDQTRPEDVDVVIGSFGGVAKLFRYGTYSYSFVRFLVLDEADSLLDDTFNSYTIPFMGNFKKHMTQFCLVGATHPTNLQPIAGNVLPMESLVTVTTPKLHRVLSHVHQTFLRVSGQGKDNYLMHFLEPELEKKNKSVVVFCNKHPTAEFVRLRLRDANVDVSGFHSGLSLERRRFELDKFARGETRVLVATDLASRGLDTIKATHVINYDFPLNMSDYVHRAGRVGRVGSPGGCKVTSFVRGPVEVKLVQKLEEAVRLNQEIPAVNTNIARILEHRRSVIDKIKAEGGDLKKH